MKQSIYILLLAIFTLTLMACGGDSDEENLLNSNSSNSSSEKNGSDDSNSSSTTYVATIYASDNSALATALAGLIEGVDLDSSGNAQITQSAIDGTSYLDLSSREITSLSGMEYFVNLATLNCSGNALTSIDLPTLTQLTYLDCSSCELSSLNTGSQTGLTYLDCSNNKLSHLDLLSNTQLQKLYADANQLASLDLSACGDLVSLECGSNSLSSLDLTTLTTLNHLYCYTNELITLDLSANTKLKSLACYDNQIAELDITSITDLTTLECGNQNTSSPIVLIMTDTQKDYWNNYWSEDSMNENVEVQGGTDLDTGTINGYEYVSLGLSVKWATCNVGASSPNGYGDYYAWGETSTKSSYTYRNSTTYGVEVSDFSGDSTLDAATANWGGTWRMPTLEEMQELLDGCQWELTTSSGVLGYKVTSNTNGNSIFLPASGYRYNETLNSCNEIGLYWTATHPVSQGESYTVYAYALWFGEAIGYKTRYDGDRCIGCTIRAVSE